MKKLCLALSLLSSNLVTAEIKEIHTLKEMEEIVPLSLRNSDWILFDIDYTLTEPELSALQMSTIKQDKQRFRDELAKFTPEQQLLIPVVMITQSPSKLMDPAAPALVKKFQNSGATVFGFTAADTASIPEIGSIPMWRQRELKRLGIDFSMQNPDSPLPNKEIEFSQFPSFRGTYPLYRDGILYCNVLPTKGEVLVAFLEKIAQKPSWIVFIDDTLENLQSVETEMKRIGIPFLGIHYKIQVDPTAPPRVSNAEWQMVWDLIHKRVLQILPQAT